MTGIDEHIRNINRAINHLGPELYDVREAARTSLHHIAAREQKQREEVERLRSLVVEFDSPSGVRRHQLSELGLRLAQS